MADTDQVLNLAAIIREVDGNNRKGAAALAESILDHPRFRAALADGPAVPEGREPVSVTGQPRPTEDDVEDAAQCIYEAMRFERVETTPAWSELGNSLAQDTARKAARAALTRWGNPAPQPPAEGEVAELVRMLTGIAYWRRRGRPGEGDPSSFDKRQADRLDRAADLLQHLRPPQPVPVSERLPGPEDCDAEGRCWWGDAGDDEFVPSWRLCEQPDKPCFDHWFPANALPLPEVK